VTRIESDDPTDAAPLAIPLDHGRVIAGRYRLERKLGEGGMGVVWSAVHLVTLRPHALKFLKRYGVDDAAARERFLREARATSAVNHAGLLPVQDVLELSDGTLCMVMDLLSGETLGDALRRQGALPLGEVASIMTRVAEAVQAAHARGVIHRDLKPDNIFLEDTPGPRSVKVLDFGIAKVTASDDGPAPASLTGTHGIVGTPLYMAPEQLFGDKGLDHRADLWAIGVILYEALAGTHAVQTDSAGALVRLVAEGKMVPLGERLPGLPGPVADLVTRLLSYDRKDRPNDLSEVVTALAPYADASERSDVVVERLSQGPLGYMEATARTMDSGATDGRSAAELPRAPATQETTAPRRSLNPEPPRAAAAQSGAPASSPGAPPARRLTPAVAAALGTLAAVGCVGAWLGLLQLHARAQSGAAVPPAAVDSAIPSAQAPLPMTRLRLPAPASTVPEAVAEYRSGMQLLHDDNYSGATAHFQRSAALDPTMALTHLRVAHAGYWSDLPQETVRDEFRRANALRDQLGERDRMFLDAYEPFFGRAEADGATVLERLRAAHERFPLDQEFALGVAVMTLGDPTLGVRAAREAVELDPSDPFALELLGRALAAAGDVDESRRALARCSNMSTGSADCSSWLARLDGEAGACEDMAHDARRVADAYPTDELSTAWAATGRPEAIVRESLVPWIESRPAERQPVDRARYDAVLDAIAGRFDAALRQLDAATAALAGTSARGSLSENGRLAMLRVHLLAETGEATKARAAAREFEQRVDLFSQDRYARRGVGVYLWLFAAAGAPLEPRRHRWTDRAFEAGASPAEVWVLAWGLPAALAAGSPPDDAKRALGALKDEPRLALPRPGLRVQLSVADGDATAGRVLLSADRAADALPYLRRAVANCFILEDPFAHVGAELDLGRALEQTGDTAAACAAYAKVTARWGHAKPRSVTADAAAKGLRRLRCAP
jgi:serine/threonine-protein kinase